MFVETGFVDQTRNVGGKTGKAEQGRGLFSAFKSSMKTGAARTFQGPPAKTKEEG